MLRKNSNRHTQTQRHTHTLKLIYEFSKNEGYKLNIQEQLHTSKNQFESEIKKTISLIIVLKIMKYLGINLTQVQYKILFEESKEDQINRIIYHLH